MLTLPDTIKIDDITSGRIKSEEIYAEIERLKMEINNLRQDMSMFINALASVQPGQNQLQYYQMVEERLKAVRSRIAEYYEQYSKLLPIINLSQIKLGHEVETSKDEKRASINATPTFTSAAAPNQKGKGVSASQPIVL